MSDVPRPGEIELEGGAEPPAIETAAEPEPAAVAADPAAEPEPAAAAEPVAPADPPAPRQVPVSELIAERTARKTLERQLREVQPLLQRLTPDVQQAILEGRVLTQPPVNTREVENARLEGVAKRFGLYKLDGQGNQVPDLDVAKNVDAGIRETAREEVAPLQHQMLAGVATGNIQKAIAFATEHGYDVDSIAETFNEVLRQPNGAAMLADPHVARTIWHQAVGRAVAAGKLPTPRTAEPPAPAKPTPPVVGADPGTRRPAGQAAIRLSPAIQKVYRENGIDPTKSFSNKVDMSNPASIELE